MSAPEIETRTPIRKRKALCSSDEEDIVDPPSAHAHESFYCPKRAKFSPPYSLLSSLSTDENGIRSPSQRQNYSSFSSAVVALSRRLSTLESAELIEFISELVSKLNEDERTTVMKDIWNVLEPNMKPQNIAKWFEAECQRRAIFWSSAILSHPQSQGQSSSFTESISTSSSSASTFTTKDPRSSMIADLYPLQSTLLAYAGHYARLNSFATLLSYLSSILPVISVFPPLLAPFKLQLSYALMPYFEKAIQVYSEERRGGKLNGIGFGDFWVTKEFECMVSEATKIAEEAGMEKEHVERLKVLWRNARRDL